MCCEGQDVAVNMTSEGCGVKRLIKVEIDELGQVDSGSELGGWFRDGRRNGSKETSLVTDVEPRCIEGFVEGMMFFDVSMPDVLPIGPLVTGHLLCSRFRLLTSPVFSARKGNIISSIRMKVKSLNQHGTVAS